MFKIDLTNSSSSSPKYYGWPDYFNNSQAVENNSKFLSTSSPNNQIPQFLIKNHPPVGKPLSLLGEGVAVTQIAISKNSSFGFPNMAFIGEFGTAAPLIHPFAQITQKQPGFTPEIKGQKVVLLNPQTGNYTDFLSLKKIDKSFRPTGIKFNPQGDALYIISNGKFEITTDVPGPASGLDHYRTGKGLYPFASLHATAWPYANTGVIWKITKINNDNNISNKSVNTNSIIRNVSTITIPKNMEK